MGYLMKRRHPVYFHWWPLFTVLLGTGCRIGEAIGLTWDDLDFDLRTISINHSVVYYSYGEQRKSEMRISKPKTEAGIRTSPMLDVVRLGVNVLGVDTSLSDMDGAKAAIAALEKLFYETLGLKSRFSDLGIDDKNFALMAKKACGAKGKLEGITALTPDDVEKTVVVGNPARVVKMLDAEKFL